MGSHIIIISTSKADWVNEVNRNSSVVQYVFRILKVSFDSYFSRNTDWLRNFHTKKNTTINSRNNGKLWTFMEVNDLNNYKQCQYYVQRLCKEDHVKWFLPHSINEIWSICFFKDEILLILKNFHHFICIWRHSWKCEWWTTLIKINRCTPFVWMIGFTCSSFQFFFF